MPRIFARPFSTLLGRSAAIAVWALALACTSDGTTPDSPSIALEVTPQQLNVVQGTNGTTPWGPGSSYTASITVTWNGAAAGDVAIEVHPGIEDSNISGVNFIVSPRVLTPSEPATTIQLSVATRTAVGSYTFAIWAVGAGVDTATSQLVLNVMAPGPPAQFEMYPVDNSPVLTNSALYVSAYVRDSEGNVIRGQVVEWAVESGGGSLDSVLSTTGRTPDGSSAGNTWHLGAGEGEQAIRLRVQGSAVAQRYVVRAFERVNLSINTLPPTVPAGSVMPINIRLVSSANVPVPRVQIRLLPIAGSSPCSEFCPLTFPELTNPDDVITDVDGASYVFTDANGEVKALWHAPTQVITGLDNLRLAFSNYPVVVPNAAQIAWTTVVKGPAALLTAYAGDNQTGTSGQPLPFPLAVKVTDQFGNLIADAVVTWTASGGGSFSTPTSVAAGDGVARNTWTLGPGAGTQTATAALSSSTTVTFSASATP